MLLVSVDPELPSVASSLWALAVALAASLVLLLLLLWLALAVALVGLLLLLENELKGGSSGGRQGSSSGR